MLLDLKETKGWPWKRIEPKIPTEDPKFVASTLLYEVEEQSAH
jgi:hypothetical protein